MSKKRDWERLEAIAKSSSAEWERRVTRNDALMKQICELQAHYGLPLDGRNLDAWLDDRETLLTFIYDLHQLIRLYDLPDEWHDNLFQFIVSKTPMLSFSVGFPAVSYPEHSIVIHTDTDISNPVVQRYIERRRRQLILRADPPPKPEPMKDNPRKLDWAPLVNWAKRHPEFTSKDIADLLHYNPVTIRRKLLEFDADK